MTLPPACRLGPYEILGPLGAGGMGEVYKARDTRLGRDVAEVQLRIALASRDYAGALRKLAAETRAAIDNQDGFWPIPLLRGQVHRLAGQLNLARRSFEAARLELEQRVRQDPLVRRLAAMNCAPCSRTGGPRQGGLNATIWHPRFRHSREG